MMESVHENHSVRARVHLQWGVKIPLRDGIFLSATLYLPKVLSGAVPAIVTLTPYIAQTYNDVGMYFAAHGYAFLAIDVRGRGNSDGEFRALINEAEDGFDVIEWVAQQDFCDGQVAMWGGSYAGYDQWATAKECPPHLAAIVPTAAAYVSVNFPISRNIASPYWMQWLTFVWGRTSQEKLFWNNKLYWGERFREWFESGEPFRSLDAQLGCTSAIFQNWVSHPHQDGYWDSYNPADHQYAAISIPVLSITGIYDAAQIGALKHFREHLKNNPSALHFLIIGPWDHAGTRTPTRQFCGIEVGAASLIDLLQLHLEWYAWTMRRGPKPQFLSKRIAYYVMEADVWRFADTLEAITSRTEALYLQSDGDPTDVFHSGRLRPQVVLNSGPDEYLYDPRDVSLASLESTVDPENRADQRMLLASVGRQLVYHSSPFERDTEVAGFFQLTLWLSIDRPDTDFRVVVYEVTLEGTAIQLTADAMRARYRESSREDKLIQTTEPMRYEFKQFPFVSRLIRKGHRLRLVVGPVNSIYSQKNYNTGGVVADESMQDACVVTVKLFHDSARASALQVPIGQSEASYV